MREHRDVTQLDVAKAVGTTGASVSEWEADKKTPREATLERLAKYLGVTPAYLRYGVEGAVLPALRAGAEPPAAPLDSFTPMPRKAEREAAKKGKKRRA